MLGACLALAAAAGLCARTASAVTRVGDVTHWQSQRINKVSGLGLVIGLAGTGDGKDYGTTINQVAKLQQGFGAPPHQLKDISTKNVAIVMVEVILPESGVREGQLADATVSALGPAKSLEGGRLLPTALVPSPDATEEFVMGFASGDVVRTDDKRPNVGVVRRGAVFEKAFAPRTVDRNGKALLIVDRPDGFNWSQTIAAVINEDQGVDGLPASLAVAVDQQTIEIAVPEKDRENPAILLAQIEDLPLKLPPRQKGVVINRKAQTITASADIEIAAGAWVVVRNLTIKVEQPAEPAEKDKAAAGPKVVGDGVKLTVLLDALDKLAVPAADRIAILENLSEDGRLNAVIKYVQ